MGKLAQREETFAPATTGSPQGFRFFVTDRGWCKVVQRGETFAPATTGSSQGFRFFRCRPRNAVGKGKTVCWCVGALLRCCVGALVRLQSQYPECPLLVSGRLLPSAKRSEWSGLKLRSSLRRPFSGAGSCRNDAQRQRANSHPLPKPDRRCERAFPYFAGR